MTLEGQRSHQGFVTRGAPFTGHCEDPEHDPSQPRDFGNAPHPDMKQCPGCWYAQQMLVADAEWKPLWDALEAEGFNVAGVDQTGGMVMCLRVVLEQGDPIEVPGYPDGTTYTEHPQRYLWWGEDENREDGVANFVLYDDIAAYRETGENDVMGTPFGPGPAFQNWREHARWAKRTLIEAGHLAE